MEAGNRFIPTSSSSLIYKNPTTSGDQLQPPRTPVVASITLREDILYLRVGSGNREISPSDNIPATTTPEPAQHRQEKLREALGMAASPKVLQYRPSTSTDTHKPGSLDLAGPLVSLTSPQRIVEVLSNDRRCSPPPAKKSVGFLMATNILQAPGLRNDYYSNLVSWSKRTYRVAVGLGAKVYWWGPDNSVRQVPLATRQMVTAVSVHAQGYLLVAVVGGTIFLVDEACNSVIDTYEHGLGTVYCFQWKSTANTFFAGDEEGNVTVFKVGNSKIVRISTLRCNQQQVCGIVLNQDETEMAVGSNNNCCMVWDIHDLMAPTMKYILPHTAAVKALAYCPWSTSLLATGAGSRDRKIRFWHTRSGTLLNEVQTDAQITGLVWSKFRKEIVATSGFANSSSPVLVSVYSYPGMIPLREVPAVPNLRILSSSTSPDATSVCVAANDYTIRVYKVWEVTHELSSESYFTASGNYGSALIELREGVSQRGATIR
ncbi:WD40 repeat-like protein [Suhomyces tanzawaensis NRRL Y-17324]|uniref:WD40 repeat-like protein n=1 Tax=Suhomyces tanzawaensis NRRL Y-17324 TaxID=984487 RepID=A0A1E4SC46_9ASCO|nr:WD40 repeat-like protein [Suhomyces tanzawaensis NRRL Y-17324]ODV77083.1 WD40 repeat-like protein [Suhomyces tanzawaensis NRRL Y-17324]